MSPLKYVQRAVGVGSSEIAHRLACRRLISSIGIGQRRYAPPPSTVPGE